MGDTGMGATGTERDRQGRRANEQLIARLRDRGDIVRPEVAAAFAAVPRHRFLPTDIPLAEVYRDSAVPILRGRRAPGLPGGLLSSSTMPGILARMLEAAGTGPGQRVLQFGTGPGWFAGLIGALVGEHGAVLSLEIEDALIDEARRHLDGVGLTRVRVRAGNGLLPAPDSAPFNQILVTASTDRVPVAWLQQLSAAGVLVVPLQLSPAFGSYPMVLLRRNPERPTAEGGPITGLGRVRFVSLRRQQGVSAGVDGDRINHLVRHYGEAGFPRERLDGALLWAGLDHAGTDDADDRSIADSLQGWKAAGMPELDRFRLSVVADGTPPAASGGVSRWIVEWDDTVLLAGLA